MAESTFNLFGPITKDDIRVGYISTDRGYVGGMSICQANIHAKKNPGATYIYKPQRDKVEFLTINEVNELKPGEQKDKTCPDGLKMDSQPDPPKLVVMGGGGIGAVGNPVIGNDGSIMAIDLVNGGFGYQYPPIAEVRDDSGIGVGAVIKVGVGTIADQTIYYKDEEDFEDIKLCPDPFTDTSKIDGGSDAYNAKKRSKYGRRWTPDGKDLGPWEPRIYTDDKTTPFEDVLKQYIKQVSSSGKDWWTTRKEPPLKVTSDGKTTREKYNVQHWAWGGGGTQSAMAEVEFDIHWNSPHRTKGLGFEFTAQDKSHSFVIRDTGGKNRGQKTVTYQVKENTTYDVKPIGKRPGLDFKTKDNAKVVELAELGLLKKMKPYRHFGKGADPNDKLDINKTGTGDKIFADFLDTLDDSDDLQVQARKGKFTASNPRKVQALRKKRTTYNLTYRLQTGREVVGKSFMNTYAISPVPPSNAKGSDFAGRWYTFEWDVDFPYDGEYVFRSARDNDAKLYIDNVFVMDMEHFRGRKSVGTLTGKSLKKNITKGSKKLKIELYNAPVKEQVITQQPPSSSSKEVTFKITSAADFANSIRIDELGIFESKKHKGAQINAKITKDIEFGRKYKVVLNSPQSTVGVRLRVKDKSILEMEEHTDNDWKDIVCFASAGQFTDIKGNIAYFSVPHPSKSTGNSAGSQGNQTRKIFNTVDYITKANRELWRTNVYNRGGFLNDYGVCPFDTNVQLKDNPYAGIHKIVWPNVNFPIDGNYDIEVAVDDNVDLTIGDQVTLNKKGFIGDTSVGTGTLKVTRFIKQGTHTITANLEQKPGGAYAFKKPDGKQVQMTDVKFKITGSSDFANSVTIPGVFSVGKKEKINLDKSFMKSVEAEKEYDVVFTSNKGNPRLRLRDNGKRVEMEDLTGNASFDDLVCIADNGTFHNIQGNRCKFRVNSTLKGINPMALAINIESTFAEKEIDARKSWNDNPMGVALTIDSPLPPVPQEPIPKQEGRCPNNPFWTTRFPNAEKKWFPVRHDAWGDAMNKHAISPLLPYDKTQNPLVDVTFEVHWYSPHRTKGLGYRFTAKDGTHSFTIRDVSKVVGQGKRTDTIKVRENTVYDVKVIGQRTAAQGSRVGSDALGGHDNSKVVELAEQGLLRQMGKTGGKGLSKFKKPSGTSDKIFADFLDTLDDADDLQIQAGVGQFTASNPRTVHSLRGTRTTYDLTYKVGKVPPNDAGSFTNTWTKEFPYGGYYKVVMSADNWGELWIDDDKVMDMGRGKSTFTGFKEKMVYISGPLSPDEPPETHKIKVVVENQKSEKQKQINAKVFNTMDWIGGSASTAEKKQVNFRITSGSMFANSIKIPELGISESKEFTPVHDNQGIPMGQRGQIKVSLQREVEVNKVYDVELLSSNSIAGVKLRTKGENVLQMEDHTDSDWTDIQCSATEGRFFDFKPGANRATCKYVVTAATRVSGGVSGSTTRDGVTYQGPHLFHYQDSRWGKVINNEGVSPIGSPTQSLSEPNDNITGLKILTWKDVKFPQTGSYQISLVADNIAKLFIGGKEVLRVQDNFKQDEYNIKDIQVGEGRHDIKVELTNGSASNIFLKDPTGVALRIYTKMVVGTGTYRTWNENPMGISAKLIPPPCPRKVSGKGVVIDPVVIDPGNGFPPGGGGGYPSALKLKPPIIKNPGINYSCKDDKIRLVPANGSKLSLCECGPFGEILKVCVEQPGFFTEMPTVVVDTKTGVNLDLALQFEVIRDPVEPLPLVQVTDLVGLKQTGYYEGRPYYGAVFYQDGVKYAGWYETAGDLVQIYDTMQESIDAQVTTPPSAILRQGSDVSSNDPRLNLPGTPENLT